MGKEKEQDLLEQFTQAVTAEGSGTLESGRVVLHVMPERVIAEIRDQIIFCMRCKADLESQIKRLRSEINMEEYKLQKSVSDGNNAFQHYQELQARLMPEIESLKKKLAGYLCEIDRESVKETLRRDERDLSDHRRYLQDSEREMKECKAKKEQLEKKLQELETELEKLNKDNLIDRYQSMILKLLEVITKDSL